MNNSNSLVKKVCIGLGALVVILLLAIAFLLGKQSAARKSDGAGRNTSDPAVVTDALEAAGTGTATVLSGNEILNITVE